MLYTLVTQWIRTGVPYAVAWLFSFKFAGDVLNYFNIDSASAKNTAVALGVFLAGTLYYIIVSTLERKFPNGKIFGFQIGFLLGIPKKPVYPGITGGPGANVPPAGGDVKVLDPAAPAEYLDDEPNPEDGK